ncbi:MAG: hypothetical protein JW846_05170 [Dehalococcoidia bacterium]|nr:hypothetical protein [Dehalococcoidia bacterium]
MKEQMTRRERVAAAMRGEQVDRIPQSFFGHNRNAERTADGNSAHLLRRAEQFKFDFIKVNLASSHYGEAWGGEYRWDEERSPVEGLLVVKPVLQTVEDFRSLPVLQPDNAVIEEQLKVTRLLHKNGKGEIPLTHTIFCPLTIAGFLAGSIARTPGEVHPVRDVMREHPDALHNTLRAITDSMAAQARMAMRAGADGVFMTNTTWTRDAVTEEEYLTFGAPYDRAVFQAAMDEGATLNVMHMCRENIMFNIMSDYPAHVLSYDSLNARNPSLDEAAVKTMKTLWAGIGIKTLLNGPEEAIRGQVRDAIAATGGKRFMLGPGCSISYKVPVSHQQAVTDELSK